MRATCPTCDTSYSIPDERIGAKGRKVRCTRCGGEWRVMLAAEPAAPEPAAPAPVVPEPAAAPTAARSVAAPPPEKPVDEFDAIAETFAETGPTAFETDADTASDEPSGEARTSADATAGSDAAEDGETARPPIRPLAGRIHIRAPAHFRKFHLDAVSNRLHGLPAHLGALANRLKTLHGAVHRAAPFAGPTVFVAACLVIAGSWFFRQAIVAAAPDLAGFYSAIGAPVNLRGLAFSRVETLQELDNGQTVLVVEGTISNVSRQMREVPALRFALRGSDTQELYAWSIDPKSTTIEAGDTIRFRTRLAAPPDQATEVQVRFVERRSQHAGLP